MALAALLFGVTFAILVVETVPRLLPGLMPKKVQAVQRIYSARNSWEDMMRGYFESRRSLRGLLVTVDIRRGIGDMDRQMLDWCSSLEVPAWILATKADKLSRNQGNQAVHAMAAEAAAWQAGVTLFSAPARTGIEAARDVLVTWLAGDSVGEKAPGT